MWSILELPVSAIDACMSIYWHILWQVCWSHGLSLWGQRMQELMGCLELENQVIKGMMSQLCLVHNYNNKLIKQWDLVPTNTLEIHWFPGHMGLEINECADALAGATFPRVNPQPTITTASCKCAFMGSAVTNWHSQALPLLQQCHICLKGWQPPLLPQLWGNNSII